MTSSNYCFLTCMQVSQEAGKVFWYSYILKNFRNMLWFTQSKALAQSTKQKKDIFLEFSCSFYDLDVGILISGFSAFSKSSLYIWMFSVHILLKQSLKDFGHYLSSMWNECNFVVVWIFLKTDFLHSVATAEFSKFGCKEYNQYFSIDHLTMFMFKVISCVVEEVVCYDKCVLL